MIKIAKSFTNPLKTIKVICKNYSTQPSGKKERIKLFWENEILLKTNLQYDLLNEEEKIIHNLHDDAVKKGHFTYYDPKTNERILTRLRHYLRGKCCGNACRHCVYNHENVFDEHKLKVRSFNSSFWSYPDKMPEVKFDDSCYFDGTNLKARTRPTPTTRFDFGQS